MLASGSSVLGSLPTWILVAIAIAAAVRITRGGGGSAIQELDKANHILEQSLLRERTAREKAEAALQIAIQENASLKEQTNFTSALSAALQPLIDWTHQHEERDQQRFESQLAAMDRIADRVVEPNPPSEGAP